MSAASPACPAPWAKVGDAGSIGYLLSISPARRRSSRFAGGRLGSPSLRVYPSLRGRIAWKAILTFSRGQSV